MIPKRLRVLHTSDAHVGDAMLQDRGVGAVRGVVDLALREQVDLVLLAGDLYDSNRVAQDIADAVGRELARLPMTAVLLPGNHDPLDTDSVIRRTPLGDRVRVVGTKGGEIVRLPAVTIWGKPHLSYADDLFPLAGAPARSEEPWHLVIAHGHLVRDAADRIRSYRIEPEEIAAAGCDYLALGHWDVPHDVSQGDVVAHYSGSPARRGVCALVDLERVNGTRAVRVEQRAVPAT